MEALKLETGQTISWFLFGEILKPNLEYIEQELAYERGQKLIAELKSADGEEEKPE